MPRGDERAEEGRELHVRGELDLVEERSDRNLERSSDSEEIERREVPLSPFDPSDIDAVILSHAHLDHCGNMHLLDRRIPVVASSTTTSMLKAMFDRMPAGDAE